MSRDFQKYYRELEEKGFAVIPEVVSPAELADLRAALDAALEEDAREYAGLPGKEDFIALDLVTRGDAFVRLLENDAVLEIFAHFLERSCILYSFTSTVVYPNQDQYTCHIHVDTPRLVPGYHLGLLMTIALDAFTVENGATFYLPGSHRTLDKPSESEFYTHAERVSRKAGDAAIFHPRVWHAGGVNETAEPRRGLTLYACRSWMRQRFDYPRMVDDNVTRLLGESGRGFLGFNVRVPISLHEFYVLSNQRLYKAGQG